MPFYGFVYSVIRAKTEIFVILDIIQYHLMILFGYCITQFEKIAPLLNEVLVPATAFK